MMQYLYSNLLFTKNTFYNNLKFYSTSLNPLHINSTPDNIVFDQNKAVLLLPSIHSVTCMEDDGEVIDSFFFEDLNTIFNNLDQGCYKMDFFFYVKSSNKLIVYNFNSTRDSLYKYSDTKGYLNLVTKFHELGSEGFRALHVVQTAGELGRDLSKVDHDYLDLNNTFDEEVVLIISKTNQTQKSSNFGSRNSDRTFNNKAQSRRYSTSNKPIGFNSDNITKSMKFYSTSIPFDGQKDQSKEVVNNSSVIKSKVNINDEENIDSIFNSDVFKSNDMFKHIHSNLINILENNPINKDTQNKIEVYLFNQYKDLAMKQGRTFSSDVDIGLLSKEFKEYCFSKVDEFNYYIDGLRNSLNSNEKLNKNIDSLNKSVDIHDFYSKKLLNTLNNEEIINFMFYTIFLIVTFNDMILEGDNLKDNEKTKIGHTTICMRLGKYLSNAYISKLYKEFKSDNNTTKQDFKEFKEKLVNTDKQYVLESSEFYLRLSSKLVEILSSCGILDIKVYNTYDNSMVIVKVSDQLEKILKKQNPIAVLPMNLPMIVEPKNYSKEELGGYLLNNQEYAESLIGSKIGYDIPSDIENNNIIYDSINNMMKTPFKVNKDLLNYLLKYNTKHKLLISSDYNHKFANIKRNKSQEKEYQRFLSKKMLEKYIILIAHIYSNVPEIYFPLRLDQRGRIYPTTAYFHYQSSELARSLLLFARPDIIKRNDQTAIEYLKAYGATCYGNGLNRKSYTKRLEWVSDNWDKIINFENSNLVSKADDKYLFLAFCFEMRRFNVFLNDEYLSEFKTYLPIQLDGTCNGFQHLALLSNETQIFDKLNLSKSKKNIDPSDFYSHVLDILNIHLEYKKKETTDINIKESLTRLLNLGLNRSIIKPVIMNRPYNATNRTLASYVRDLLVYDHTDEISEYDDSGVLKVMRKSWYKISEESINNCVNFNDLEFLVKCIDEIIYVKYPKIKLLTNYFHEIGLILNKLNLPIIWRLPHGLKVSQKYMMKHTLKINPFAYLSNTLSLTITDKIKIDKQKQLSAFMPNLVHSLDATTLILLYNSLVKNINSEGNKTVNFYSIHDCYGVTAKYVEVLIEMLRTVYIKLYSGPGYIEKFDEDIINTIVISYGEENCKYDPETRTIIISKRKKIVLPDLSKFLNVPNKSRVYKSLSKAIFLIK